MMDSRFAPGAGEVRARLIEANSTPTRFRAVSFFTINVYQGRGNALGFLTTTCFG